MNELFKNYAKHHPGINYHFSKQEYEEAAKGYYEIYKDFLPKDKNAKILDLGCGTGHFLYFTKKLGYTNYHGIDISKRSVKFCIEHITKNVTAADGCEFLKESDEKWDLVVMDDVIQHIRKEKIIAISKMVFSNLVKEGVFIVKTPNMEKPPFKLQKRYSDFTHAVGFASGSLSQVLKIASFNETRIHPTDVGKNNLKGAFFLRKIILMIIGVLFEIPFRKSSGHLCIQHSKNIFAVAKKTS